MWLNKVMFHSTVQRQIILQREPNYAIALDYLWISFMSRGKLISPKAIQYAKEFKFNTFYYIYVHIVYIKSLVLGIPILSVPHRFFTKTALLVTHKGAALGSQHVLSSSPLQSISSPLPKCPHKFFSTNYTVLSFLKARQTYRKSYRYFTMSKFTVLQ